MHFKQFFEHKRVNTTIELASLKSKLVMLKICGDLLKTFFITFPYLVPDQSNDLWLEDHKATLNSLEIILGFILFCDQIFYMLLLLYLLLFVVKFIRFQLIGKVQMCFKSFRLFLYRQRCKRNLKYKSM